MTETSRVIASRRTLSPARLVVCLAVLVIDGAAGTSPASAHVAAVPVVASVSPDNEMVTAGMAAVSSIEYGNTLSFTVATDAPSTYAIRPDAVRIDATMNATGVDVSAFRNSDGSIAVVALNSAHRRQATTFSLHGLRGAHIVTPYLTETSHQLSAQSPITVRHSAFTATLPPRALVSYDIRP